MSMRSAKMKVMVPVSASFYKQIYTCKYMYDIQTKAVEPNFYYWIKE